jgi:hypothetical protein
MAKIVMAEGEKRKLTEDLAVRTAISVGTIPAGSVIEIQQVNAPYRQVLVDNVWFADSTIARKSELIAE